MAPRVQRLAPARRAGERRREQRHADTGDDEPDGEDEPGGGEDQRGSRDGDDRDDERSGRRADTAQVEPLQRVDVADHAAHEIAAAEPLELGRRERLDARVEPGPDASE